jgi:hypothetical protein
MELADGVLTAHCFLLGGLDWTRLRPREAGQGTHRNDN